MRTSVCVLLLCLGPVAVIAQGNRLIVPSTVEAGSAFTIQSSGSGKGTLYLVGPGGALKQDVQLGEKTFFSAGSLYNAGRYVAVLTSDSGTDAQAFDVAPSSKPANLSFLAKPSRLPVGMRGGITGTVYVFDAYENLIVSPESVTFELSSPLGAPVKRTMEARDGVASVEMDSTAQQGKDTFVSRVGDLQTTRVIRQVPGDPCSLKMNARELEGKIEVETEPVRDCSGNAVPDGTIVTFTEAYNGEQSTVDVPLKRGVAKVEMPAHGGATISVASGIVLGNQIRWEK
jgi:hypothetical protein